ncbi:MAG: DUF2304 domain-containing protein [Lentisphaeria bacterium]|nr:DUF2304 domain-containing protein [Lentisphaeria bacterium]
MTLIQYIALFGSLCFLVTVFWAIHRGILSAGYALLWIVVTCGMIVLAWAPRLLNYVAMLIQVYTPPFVLVLFMLGGMILLLFQQSIIISRQTEKLKRLTEEVTLLKAEKADKNNAEK